MSTDPRLEKIARAMANADLGHDEYPPPMEGALRGMQSGEPNRFGDPAWKRYCAEAKRFLAAHDAIRA